MTVHVPPTTAADLTSAAAGESSAALRARVERARRAQRERYSRLPGVFCNAHASGHWLEKQTSIDPTARAALVQAAERLHLSARAYHRVLRVGRTVADLEGCESVLPDHIAAGVRYRTLGIAQAGHTRHTAA